MRENFPGYSAKVEGTKTPSAISRRSACLPAGVEFRCCPYFGEFRCCEARGRLLVGPLTTCMETDEWLTTVGSGSETGDVLRNRKKMERCKRGGTVFGARISSWAADVPIGN